MSRSFWSALCAVVLACFAAAAVAGCATGPGFAPAYDKVGRTNEDLKAAQAHFYRGEFGLAEKRFRSAVESDPQNPEAWIGLAASYDQLSRFELADRSYARAKELTGETPVLLNNMGYSRLLRGDLGEAKKLLVRAQELDPLNLQITNNIRKLNTKLAKVGRKPVQI